jgi:MraZ protein
MFLGEYVYLMDKDKENRLTIPVVFRNDLGEKGFLTKGNGSYLCLYPEKEWEKLIEGWKKLPLKGVKYRRFWRAICSGTMEIELDAQGRCFIPNYLKECANLKREVIFVGRNVYIEIWDSENFRKGGKDATDMDRKK